MTGDDVHLLIGRWTRDFADQGIFTTDASLTVTSWNRWLEQHSGRRADEVIDRPLGEALPDLRTHGLFELYNDALAGRPHVVSHLLHGQLLFLRSSLGARQFGGMRQRARISPLMNGQTIVGTITVIDDVSERVGAEQELRKEIAAHRDARVAAEQAVHAKDEFLAMLGHELRNPLAPIMTALELIKWRGVDDVEEERAVIERQTKHMVAMVDDLLDISRITRGVLELRRLPVDMSAVVGEAVEMAGPLLQQRRHRLVVHVPPAGFQVIGDFDRLAQAVSNLLTNAAKYTEPGGTISVIGESRGDEIDLRVGDTGSGIGSEMLTTIFDPFVQEVQTSDRRRGGLGLGLAIVHNVITLHGGTVTASSEGKDRGAEFTIRLPRVTAPLSPAEPAADRLGPVTHPIRVLVVDDNADAARLLADLLCTLRHEATFAVDGPSALQVAARFKPDVALVDIGLPVMDGYELARRFAAEPDLRAIRMIALTGYGQAQDRSKTEAAGFEAHLVKPVSVAELRRALESIDRRAQAAATADRSD